MTAEGTWSISWSAERVYISPPGGEGFDDIPRGEFDRMVAQYMWVQVEVRNFDDPETALLKRAHDILWPDEASDGAANALAASGREGADTNTNTREGRSGTAREAPSTFEERGSGSATTQKMPDVGVQPASPLLPEPASHPWMTGGGPRPAANPEYTPEAIAEILRLDVEASEGRLMTPAEFLADLNANPEPQGDAIERGADIGQPRVAVPDDQEPTVPTGSSGQADAVKALREALEPFADLARQIAEEHPGWDHNIFQFGYPFPETFMRDLRRARAALNLPAPDAVAVEPVADRLYKTLRHARAFVVLRMTPMAWTNHPERTSSPRFLSPRVELNRKNRKGLTP